MYRKCHISVGIIINPISDIKTCYSLIIARTRGQVRFKGINGVTFGCTNTKSVREEERG